MIAARVFELSPLCGYINWNSLHSTTHSCSVHGAGRISQRRSSQQDQPTLQTASSTMCQLRMLEVSDLEVSVEQRFALQLPGHVLDQQEPNPRPMHEMFDDDSDDDEGPWMMIIRVQPSPQRSPSPPRRRVYPNLFDALEEVSRALAGEDPRSFRPQRDTGAQDSAGSPPTTPGVADQSGGERSDSQ